MNRWRIMANKAQIGEVRRVIWQIHLRNSDIKYVLC